MTPEQDAKLDFVFKVFSTLLDPWGGGISNVENGDGQPDPNREKYQLAQYILRNNVEIHQTLKAVDRVSENVDTDRQDLLNAIGSLQAEVSSLKAKLAP